MLTPTDIRSDVTNVLRGANVFMSAYQILEELPTGVRDQIIQERGMPGQGNGRPFTAAGVVAEAVQMLEGHEIFYSGTRHLKFEVQGKEIRSGGDSCAFYRLKQQVA
jgi:hypothetical protein